MYYKLISGEDSRDLSRLINNEFEQNKNAKFAKILATNNIELESLDIESKGVELHVFSSEGIGDYVGQYYNSGVMVIFADYDVDLTIVNVNEIEKMPIIESNFSFMYSSVDLVKRFREFEEVINVRHKGVIFGTAFDEIRVSGRDIEDSFILLSPKDDLEFRVQLTPHWDAIHDKAYEISNVSETGAVTSISGESATGLFNNILKACDEPLSTVAASVNGNLSGIAHVSDSGIHFEGPVKKGDLIYFCARNAKLIADDFYYCSKDMAVDCKDAMILTDSNRVAIMDEFDTLMDLEYRKKKYFSTREETGFGGASRGIYYKDRDGKLCYRTHTVGFVGIVK